MKSTEKNGLELVVQYHGLIKLPLIFISTDFHGNRISPFPMIQVESFILEES